MNVSRRGFLTGFGCSLAVSGYGYIEPAHAFPSIVKRNAHMLTNKSLIQTIYDTVHIAYEEVISKDFPSAGNQVLRKAIIYKTESVLCIFQSSKMLHSYCIVCDDRNNLNDDNLITTITIKVSPSLQFYQMEFGLDGGNILVWE